MPAALLKTGRAQRTINATTTTQSDLEERSDLKIAFEILSIFIANLNLIQSEQRGRTKCSALITCRQSQFNINC
jgi:hypothetical protein